MTTGNEGAEEIAGDLVKRAGAHGGDKLLEEASVLILWFLEEREALMQRIGGLSNALAEEKKMVLQQDEYINELTQGKNG